MKRDELEGKFLAVLMMAAAPASADAPGALDMGAEDDEDEEEDEAELYTLGGEVRGEGPNLYIDRGAEGRFELRAEWLARVKPVPDDLRDTLTGADYYLSLLVDSLPEGANPVAPTGAGRKPRR